jgi:curved DNA-binding protein
MPATDFYATLGVPSTASAEEIRKAHKKLSRKYHPDANQDDKTAEAKFKEVQTAFEVLGDEDKRKKYDQFGPAAFEGGMPQGGFHRGPGGGPDLSDLFGGQVDLGDLFGGFGGGGNRRGNGRTARPRKGEDSQVEITVPFTIACEGGSHELQLNRGGSVERLTVKIPAGIDHGAVIRLGGQGEPGYGGGPAGDLLCTVRVAPHPWFRREGQNLLVDVPVSLTEAALGGKVDCPTLSEGRVTLTLPAGTASGSKLRLKGKGVLDRQTNQRGDQFAVVKIVPPTNVTPAVRDLLERLAVELPSDPRAGLWS